MNICYLDFWPGFDPNSNWFNLIFRDLFENKDINFNSSAKEADIIFASSFGNSRKEVTNLKSVRIFYTGENERPDLDFSDYSLSFDFDTYGNRNFRLPHWYMYVNWWNEPNFKHARISKEQLVHKYDPEDIWNREHFCSIVIGNPVQNRIETALALNSMKPVHGYGKVFGKPFDGCKVELLSNYRWNICFENSITDGYITEKLLEAKIAGCIPLYYGPDISEDFNPACAINTAGISIESIFDWVNQVENDKDMFIKKASEPLFNYTPNLDNLYNFLRYVLKDKL
jgi:hypothetical protein